MTERLAAALLALGDIPFEHAQEMSAKQINSLYQFDHWPIRVEADGANHPSNMRPLLIAAHRAKTASDNREIGKIRRTRRKRIEHEQRMLAKGEAEIDGATIPVRGKPWIANVKRQWPSRPFPKREKKRRRHRAVAVAEQ